jgi:NADPH2:quinone reductase
MAHAIVVERPGGPEVLKLVPVDVAAPGPGQARVRHTAIGVNFIDVYHRSGLYPLPAWPHGLGMEAAGVVEAIGPGVVDLAVGDRVAYAGRPPGSYATERVLPADRLVPLPRQVDDRTAAASMLKGMTTEYLVRRTFPVEAGMDVLVHAAAGGVGLLACQWLRYLGARVIGTVGSDDKAALARAHGCAHPIVYTREDFVARVRELTDGAGVHVVYDSVGKSTFAGSLRCLRRRGTLVAFGNASGKPEPLDVLELSHLGSLYVTRPTLVDYTSTRDELLESAAELFGVLESGAVRVKVQQSWPLRDAAAAHRALESRATTGSTILLP